MAEFIYNNTPSASIGLLSFFANYGYYPLAYNPPAEPCARNPINQYYTHWITQVYNNTRKRLKKSRVRIKEWVNKRQNSPRTYTVGQLIILNARHLKTRYPTHKFDYKMVGPFRILNIIFVTGLGPGYIIPGPWPELTPLALWFKQEPPFFTINNGVHPNWILPSLSFFLLQSIVFYPSASFAYI